MHISNYGNRIPLGPVMNVEDGPRNKKHIQVKRRFFVISYNDKIGKVDICDRMLSFYKIHATSI